MSFCFVCIYLSKHNLEMKVESQNQFSTQHDTRIYKCEECGIKLIGCIRAEKHKGKVCVKIKKEVDERWRKKKEFDANDTRLFECKECGVKSIGYRRAEGHKDIHKLIKCTKCEIIIKTKSFNRHKETCFKNGEFGNNIHNCDKCTYSTNRTDSLRAHKKRRHNVKLEVQEPKKAKISKVTKKKESMKCQFCSYESKIKSNFQRHTLTCKNKNNKEHVFVFI